jgi:HPt (histidine-containing phosphotransfer) domain-containing protein
MDLDALPIHDPEHAYEQMGCDAEKGKVLLCKLSAIALRDIPPKLSKLLAAMEEGDLQEAGAVAHNLKSSVSHVGAPAIFAACKRAEAACREGCQADAEEMVGWIYGHWPALQVILEEYAGDDDGA